MAAMARTPAAGWDPTWESDVGVTGVQTPKSSCRSTTGVRRACPLSAVRSGRRACGRWLRTCARSTSPTTWPRNPGRSRNAARALLSRTIRRPSAEELDPAAREVIHRADDPDLAVLLQCSQHRAALTDRSGGEAHVGAGHLVNKCGVFAAALAVVARGVHRWLDLVQQTGEVAKLGAVNRTFYRATAGMPHHQDHLGAGHGAGKLQAAEQIVIGDISGDAGIEGVANTGVENDLSRRA